MASKLPEVGTTIFAIMSRRARELDALNLGQGFPDYDIDPRLTELVAAAMTAGHNQYAPMEGLPALRERIAAKLLSVYGLSADPESEITITLGATEAIFSAVQAVIGAGDEAIAGNHLLIHAEVATAVRHQLVHLLECAFVQQ